MARRILGTKVARLAFGLGQPFTVSVRAGGKKAARYYSPPFHIATDLQACVAANLAGSCEMTNRREVNHLDGDYTAAEGRHTGHSEWASKAYIGL